MGIDDKAIEKLQETLKTSNRIRFITQADGEDRLLHILGRTSFSLGNYTKSKRFLAAAASRGYEESQILLG